MRLPFTVPKIEVAHIICGIIIFFRLEYCVTESAPISPAGNTSSLDTGRNNDGGISKLSTSNRNASEKDSKTVFVKDFPIHSTTISQDKLTGTSFNSSENTENTTVQVVGVKPPNDDSVTRTYDIISWLPKPTEPGSAVNLTILPILAMLAFLIMLCLKGCTWFRESMKDTDQDSFEEDRNFIILQEGDKEYNDIDFRSDLSTPYDTYSSYMSFLRRNNNYDTVTSVRSLQGSRPYDTVTSYRSLMLQRLENPNNDSVTSYRAFLQRVMKEREQMKDVEIQVELIDEKLKTGDRHSNIRNSKRQRSNSSSPKLISKRNNTNGDTGVMDSLLKTSSTSEHHNGKKDICVGNGVVSKDESIGRKTDNKRHYEKSPTRQIRNRSPVKNRCERSPIRRLGECIPTSSDVPGGKKNGHQSSKVPRFRVSFVTDDEKHIDVIKANNTHLLEPEDGKLSPTSVNVPKQDVGATCYSFEQSDDATQDSLCKVETKCDKTVVSDSQTGAHSHKDM